MKFGFSIYCRLQEHFVEEKSCGITLQTIHTKFRDDGGVLDIKSFGKYVRALFKDVKVLRKSGKYFYNLKEKEVEETHGISVDLDLIQQWVSSPFFLCEKSDQSMQWNKISLAQRLT